MSEADLQQQVDEWNELYPPGTEVVLTDDEGQQQLTSTRSAAEVLSGHTAVIWVEGISGCYLLDRIQPRRCKVCGCTTFDPCQLDEGPCSWVAADLCSGCVSDDYYVIITEKDALMADVELVHAGLKKWLEKGESAILTKEGVERAVALFAAHTPAERVLMMDIATIFIIAYQLRAEEEEQEDQN